MDAGAQAAFDIPAGMKPPISALFWNEDGPARVEIPSVVVNGQVVFTVTRPGIYALVSP